MSEKQQQQQEQKPSYEGKNKKPSTAEVSLDNADTVIDAFDQRADLRQVALADHQINLPVACDEAHLDLDWPLVD